MDTYADIVFPTAVRQLFTYEVPEKLVSNIAVGMRVWVPLRKHRAIGMVVRLHQNKPSFNTRPVAKILDKKPILSDELLRLTRWVHHFYYASWGEVIQAALPAGLNFYAQKMLRVAEGETPQSLDEEERYIVDEVASQGDYPLKTAEKRWKEYPHNKVLKKLIGRKVLEIWEQPALKTKPRFEKGWNWAEGVGQTEIAYCLEQNQKDGEPYKWVKALEALWGLELPERQSVLKEHQLLDAYTLGRIEKEGLLTAMEMPVADMNAGLEYDPTKIKQLNTHQQKAFEAIKEPISNHQYKSFLLFGVTGSGKTEVYIHALQHALAQGKGGIVLVPEISLTPQTVKRFYQIFGDDIAVLHSRLNNSERYEAWHALHKGEKRIAIGARSAVFAPVQNLGLIVIDEEHDASYKQFDPAPRYHARETAVMRAYQNDAVVVLGSATPSMIALYGASQGKHELLKLPSRHAQTTLPEVYVIDFKQYRSAMRGPLAVPLFEAIEQALEREEQVILLYNRRGFASYLQCGHCGHIAECPNCSVSLTYHKAKKQLQCHYCGFSQRADSRCEECHRPDLQSQGGGTQKIEEEITGLFPEARVLRMDQDTTTGKNAHARILNQFGMHQADILLGTQLVAKGLDFPNVTVVGVINADTELAFPSFRSGERMYQLLSQVAGRSGRADKEGVVYFQTWQPDHPAIQSAKVHNHQQFARQELAQRKPLWYPPYSRIITFNFKSKDPQLVGKVAHAFGECLHQVAHEATVIGPAPAAIVRLSGWFRWECSLKITTNKGPQTIEQLIDAAFALYDKNKPPKASNVRINVNVDAME